MNRNSESMKTSSNPAGRIAVFASGNGSNAENIIRYFREADRGDRWR